MTESILVSAIKNCNYATFAFLHLPLMKTLTLLIFLLAFVMLTNGQDRYFARTYTANVLAKGGIDLELWHTSRFGHSKQFFHAMDQRMELEVGLGSRLQTALYFNRFQKTFSDSTGEMVNKTEAGFSNEWKWQLNKPTIKGINVALYAELGIKGDELELETKFIADKAFGNNLVAFNLVYEQEHEFERENGKTALVLAATPVEFDLAYMHYIKPQFGLGVEVVNKNDIIKGVRNNSLLFAGPSINYRGNSWFVIANYLPQLVNLKRTASYPLSTDLFDHEKAEVRILFGISL